MTDVHLCASRRLKTHRLPAGIFTLFAEHKEPVAPTMPQSQKPTTWATVIWGNGLTVWNRLEEEHGDYKTVAHWLRPHGTDL